MVKIFGWWVFDPEKETLINEVTGERVRIIGRLAQKDHWLKFQYEHEGVVFPIFVEKIDAPCNDIEYGPHDRGKNTDSRMPTQGIVWKINYIRSAKAWQQEFGQDSTYPGYGLWRRVDDCVIDALYFWPERKNSGLPPVRVAALGGWLNGKWDANWERVFGFAVKNIHRLLRTDLENEPPVKEAWLCPLDEPTPPPWKFIDDVAHSDIQFWGFQDWEVIPKINRLGERMENGGTKFLDNRIPLSGFENKTIYLQAQDNTSVIGYSLGYPRGPHTVPCCRFGYADKFMSGFLETRQYSYSTPTGNLSLFYIDYQGSILFSSEQNQRYKRIEWSMEISRRRLPVIRDAFLFWGGTEYRRDTWDSRLNLKAREWVLFNPNYLGGVAGLSVNCAARRL